MYAVIVMYNYFIFLISENDVDMIVFTTLLEEDLKSIGIESFGVRRKLSLVIKRMKSTSIETPAPIPSPSVEVLEIISGAGCSKAV